MATAKKTSIKKVKNSPHWELKVEGVKRKMLFSGKAKAEKFLSEMNLETAPKAANKSSTKITEAK